MATRARVGRTSFRARAALFASAATLVGALLPASACSSSSPSNPPLLGGCTEKSGVPCTAGVVGGGTSPAADGSAADDASPDTLGDAASCSGATQIFGTSTAACVACIAATCCLNPTSCPNDSSCSLIAVCIMTCLPTDPTCVPGCEAQGSASIVTEFTDLASCSASNCPACPTLPTGAGDI